MQRKGVHFMSHDKAKPFHRVIFDVNHLLKPAGEGLTSQYRTRPVLELMGVIEASDHVPVILAGPSTKRKRDATLEDTKPTHKALLAARVKELEVSW